MRAIIRRLLLALVIASAFPAIAAAQNGPAPENVLRQGAQAAQRGDYAEARRKLNPYAGDARAAFMLGQMDFLGQGGPVDHAAAARHFTVGTLQGHIGSMFNLGYLYDRGWGVLRNGAQAQELYIATGNAGVLMAKNNLAYLWARQGGLLEQALCLSAQTLEREPNNPVFLDTYGFILLQMNQPARAEAYFRKVLKSEPYRTDALEHLGDVAAMTGKGDAAAYWRQALANPRDARQSARLAAKLGGASPPYDLDAHPPFGLRNPGLPAQCGVPSV